MKKLLTSKYGWVAWVVILAALNLLAAQIHYRLDLTQEKRFTLSAPTRNLLNNLDDQVSVDLFLKGDLKAGARKLAKSMEELLSSFKDYSGGRVQFRAVDPLVELNDSDKAGFFDSLQRMGIQPKTELVQSGKGDEQTQRTIIPGAIVRYKNRSFPVDLLKGVSQTGEADLYNNAEALLEYKFGNAIDKITQKSVPLIGYVTGNGEPLDFRVYDLIQNTLKKDYVLKIFPLDNDSIPIIPSAFSAMIIVKPTRKFTEGEKLKLDQYTMHGGNLMWMIDNLTAEMDSLRADRQTLVFDRALGLEDLFFKYGVRVNADLVEDLQCAPINLVVGMQGDKPQLALVNCPYFPLLQGSLTHPISKNLDPVLSKFANSIDTVKAGGIRKTVILQGSLNGRIIGTPVIVSFEELKSKPDPSAYNKAHIPVGLLLEGKFNSLFANRISSGMFDTLANLYHSPFLAGGEKEAKTIVIADADIAMNDVTPKGPLPLGMDKDIQYTFSNQNFISNSIDWLVDSSGILETRSKDYTLRLLDPKKVEEDRSYWQFVNIVAPILLVIAGGYIYQFRRRRKYQLIGKPAQA
jgi:ABC-2 type transport system permease protein